MCAFYGIDQPLPTGEWAVRLAEDGPDGAGAFGVLGAWDGEELAAFALYSTVYHLAGAGDMAILRDLFVREGYRRRKIGTALMVGMAALCVENGWRRLDWQANRLDFETRTFYDMLCPGSFKLDRLSYRVEGDEIAALAARKTG